MGGYLNEVKYVDHTALLLALRRYRPCWPRKTYRVPAGHVFNIASFPYSRWINGKLRRLQYKWLGNFLHNEQLRPGRQGAKSAAKKNIPHGKRGEIQRKEAYVRSALLTAKLGQWEKEVGEILPNNEFDKREKGRGQAHGLRTGRLDGKRGGPHAGRIRRSRGKVKRGKN